MAEQKAKRAIWLALLGVILVVFIILIVFGEIFQCQRNVPAATPPEESHTSANSKTVESPIVCLSLHGQTFTTA